MYRDWTWCLLILFSQWHFTVFGVWWVSGGTVLMTGVCRQRKGFAGCGQGPGRTWTALAFCQHSPWQVVSYQDISPQQWRSEGSPVTPRSMSGKGIKSSSQVNDVLRDSQTRASSSSERPSVIPRAGPSMKMLIPSKA